jgi:thioredoxin-related protein
MKIISLIALITLLSVSAKPQTFKLNYASSFKQALKNSKTDNKPIALFFFLKNGENCKGFSKDFFYKRELVSAFNQKTIPYRVNLETKEGKSLIQQYGISTYPSLVFVDSKKNRIHKVAGQMSTQRGLETLNNLTEQTNTLAFLEKTYKTKNPKKPEFLLQYSEALVAAAESYQEIINEYFDALTDEQLFQAENVDAIIKYSKDIYSREFISFAKKYTVVKTKNIPESAKLLKVEELISNHLMNALSKDQKLNVRDSLQKIIEFYQIRNVAELNSRVWMDYYRLQSKPDNYVNAIIEYTNHHLGLLSGSEIAELCYEIMEQNRQAEIDFQALTWINEANDRDPSLEGSYTRLLLLVKVNQIEEAEDYRRLIRERYSDELTSEWEQKLENSIHKRDN